MVGIEIKDEFDPDDRTDEDKERLEVAALLAGDPYIWSVFIVSSVL